jgi:exodeoxyribonuclease VII large subunit
MADPFYTVSELNDYIRDVVRSGFPQPVWVCGEIQQYDRNRNKKHVFFELVEKDPDSQDIRARVGLVIFANRKWQIEAMLKKSENAFTLKDDIEVKFCCRVDYYAPHGALRLIVETIDPTYTLGKLAQEKQKLIAQLKKEGVFEKNKQRLLSPVPLNVGLVTAGDSAAYNDFISELRKSGLAFTVRFRNTIMQGKNCEDDVCRALKQLNRAPVDAVVITRGGGSLADLSSFDSQKIAYAVAAMDKPVLSGIGHEINLSVTDLTAHTFAKTPTAIARFLITTVEAFEDVLDQHLQGITDLALARVEQENTRLRNNAGRLHEATVGYLKEHHEKMIRYQEVLKQRPGLSLARLQEALRQKGVDLSRSARQYVVQQQKALDGYAKIIAMVHPVNTLKRGFSITRRPDGKALRSKAEAAPGQTLTTEVADGQFRSTVDPDSSF